jgi:hypothetical protein
MDPLEQRLMEKALTGSPGQQLMYADWLAEQQSSDQLATVYEEAINAVSGQMRRHLITVLLFLNQGESPEDWHPFFWHLRVRGQRIDISGRGGSHPWEQYEHLKTEISISFGGGVFIKQCGKILLDTTLQPSTQDPQQVIRHCIHANRLLKRAVDCLAKRQRKHPGL